jgi:hypothetical protein
MNLLAKDVTLMLSPAKLQQPSNAQAMLSLPQCFWPEAMAYACA